MAAQVLEAHARENSELHRSPPDSGKSVDGFDELLVCDEAPGESFQGPLGAADAAERDEQFNDASPAVVKQSRVDALCSVADGAGDDADNCCEVPAWQQALRFHEGEVDSGSWVFAGPEHRRMAATDRLQCAVAKWEFEELLREREVLRLQERAALRLQRWLRKVMRRVATLQLQIGDDAVLPAELPASVPKRRAKRLEEMDSQEDDEVLEAVCAEVASRGSPVDSGTETGADRRRETLDARLRVATLSAEGGYVAGAFSLGGTLAEIHLQGY